MALNKRIRPATEMELQRLYAAVASLKTSDEVEAFLKDVCTIREVEEMSQRLEVARLLADRVPYISITEKTGASATTIARVAKSLNYGAGGYQQVLGLKDQEYNPLP